MRLRTLAGSGVLALALTVGFSHSAFAQELTPEQAVSAADTAVATQGAAVAADPLDGLEVTLPSDQSPQASAGAENGSTVTIEPAAATQDVTRVGDKTVTALDSPASSVVTESVADGVRNVIVVNGPDAPTSYDFLLGLPEGVNARLADNGAVLLELQGEEGASLTVGSIEVPWAKDANGASIPTHFELNGDVLTQIVDHQGAAYPVSADPKLTYGAGVYLNLWGYEANNLRYSAGAAIAALTLYGCNFASFPANIPNVVIGTIRLICTVGGGASLAIGFLQSLINGQGNYDGNQCYQTRIVPPNGTFVGVGPENCS
jgi:hypothetical protein